MRFYHSITIVLLPRCRRQNSANNLAPKLESHGATQARSKFRLGGRANEAEQPLDGPRELRRRRIGLAVDQPGRDQGVDQPELIDFDLQDNSPGRLALAQPSHADGGGHLPRRFGGGAGGGRSARAKASAGLGS
jgi:hypothetical protein